MLSTFIFGILVGLSVNTVNAEEYSGYIAASEDMQIIGEVTNLTFDNRSCSFDVGTDRYEFLVDTVSIIDSNTVYSGSDGKYDYSLKEKNGFLAINVTNNKIHYSLRGYENGNFAVWCKDVFEYAKDNNIKMREITRHEIGES